MKQAWWDSDFRKFGHAGIKALMSSPAVDGDRSNLPTLLTSRYKNMKALISET